jgi:peptidoglycan/LPS O-acetylase OafA/YrhL
MTRDRFAILDGLRGIAALVVLVFHLTQQKTLAALPYAGLAVDFFYVLSGFVVAFAYEHRIATSEMSIGSFIAVRLKRLYPLILLGTSAGIGLAAVAAATKRTISPHEIVGAGVLGLLLLPSFVIPRWPTAYPFNMASWSLTFELFVNIVFAAIARWLSGRVLAIILLLSAVALVWLAYMRGGVNGGNDQDGWSYGSIRVMFPFFAGVYIYRVRPKMRTNSGAALLVLACLCAILLNRFGAYRAWSLAYVLVAFPAIVFIGSAVSSSPVINTSCSFLGALSYPVYILQGPVLRIGEEVLRHKTVSGIHFIVFACVEGFAVIVVGWLGLKLFDEPIQRKLKGKFAPPSSLRLAQRP